MERLFLVTFRLHFGADNKADRFTDTPNWSVGFDLSDFIKRACHGIKLGASKGQFKKQFINAEAGFTQFR